MAWALQFDGVNDYASSSVVVPKPIGDSYLEIDVIFDSITVGTETFLAWIGPNGAQGIGISVRYDGRIVYYGRGNSIGSASYLAVAGERHTLRLEHTSNVYIGYFDGVEVGRFNNIAADSDSDGFFFGKTPTSAVGNDAFSLVSCVWVDVSTPSNNRTYDPTASSHAAGTPVLTDTIGGNNATGVNMPTDGSAWVDLGGGGATGVITQTTESFTQSSVGTITSAGITGAITQTAQSFTQSLSASLGYAGLINQTTQSFTQSLIGTALLSISGEITQTLQSFTQSATGATLLNITGTINQAVGAFTQSANGILITPITGSITQITSSFTMSLSGSVPVQWVDKAPATAAWSNQANVTTTWTNQAGVSTIWTDKV